MCLFCGMSQGPDRHSAAVAAVGQVDPSRININCRSIQAVQVRGGTTKRKCPVSSRCTTGNRCVQIQNLGPIPTPIEEENRCRSKDPGGHRRGGGQSVKALRSRGARRQRSERTRQVSMGPNTDTTPRRPGHRRSGRAARDAMGRGFIASHSAHGLENRISVKVGRTRRRPHSDPGVGDRSHLRRHTKRRTESWCSLQYEPAWRPDRSTANGLCQNGPRGLNDLDVFCAISTSFTGGQYRRTSSLQRWVRGRSRPSYRMCVVRKPACRKFPLRANGEVRNLGRANRR
jgi:hypothetical protein